MQTYPPSNPPSNFSTVDFPPLYPAWLQGLKQKLNQPPFKPRLPLYLNAFLVGSIETNLALRLVKQGLLSVDNKGEKISIDAADTTQVNAALARIAHWLHEQKLAAPWKDELIPILNDKGKVCAHIERAVARPLGITTLPVYLIGVSTGGGIWLQRRAEHKATSPGMLDVLVGGLVSGHESLQQALAREAQEEAGLYLQQLPCVIHGGNTLVRRPVDPDLEGYMIEQGHWSIVQLPEGVIPSNQDGEVSEFVLLEPAEVLQKMLAGQLTPEACLVLSQYFDANWQGQHPE